MYLILPEVLSLIEQSRKNAEYLMDQNVAKSNELFDLTQEAMKKLPSFERSILDDHLYLIIPLLLRTASSGRQITPGHGPNIQRVAIEKINEMVVCPTFREFGAQVIH
jgi:hypothetical protein